jgi:signal transduction histidine kinase/CheY-like chemotaxis protein
VLYQNLLEPTDAGWSPPSREAARSFAGLAPGRYTLQARAVDRWGRTGPVEQAAFAIPTPWWKSWSALAAYFGAAILVAYGVVRRRLTHLERQNAKLNQLVAERTRALELSDTAKSEFLENISHEIRNPLTGLTGLLAMFQEDQLKPRERELSRSLKACAQHLTRVAEEVLGFSKLEYGYITLEKQWFSLRQLVNEVKDLFAVQAAQSGCAVEVRFPPAFADEFQGDEAKIRTILANFLGNAIKYAPGQPVTVTLEINPTEAGSDLAEITLEVSDRGPGIPEEEQELVFQKFVRGKQAKQGKVAGTGLGLATCRMLARAMNGQVGLESEPGQGSTFFLRLWLKQRRDPGKLAKTTGDEPAEASPGSGQPALVVEDEIYNQTVLKGIAVDLGYQVALAGNAAEAFVQCKTQTFAVIFLDWELPGMKGGDIARAIRSGENGRSPIIIATTAHDSEEIREKCRDAGMDGFLLKPYTKAGIRNLLGQVEARRAGKPDLAEADEQPIGELNRDAFTYYGKAEPALAAQAVADFLKAVDHEMALLAESLAHGDSGAVAASAHRAQALAGIVGARRASEAARQLFERAPRASEAEKRALAAQLTEALGAVKQELS